MAETTNISWADKTFNPWIGCTGVSPACDHCYAEAYGNRFGVEWGPGKPRRRTSPGYWEQPARWNAAADAFRAAHGHYPRVFAASLADIFDNEVDPQWRVDFFDVVRATPKLIWLIVTKRIGNVAKMLPPDWGAGWPNVVLIITVANQAEADRDVPKLLRTPAWRRGLSVEPLLDAVDLKEHFGMYWNTTMRHFESVGRKFNPGVGRGGLDWIIVGGESQQLEGPRPLIPLEVAWARDLRDQCVAAGVPFHFKQWGHTIPADQAAPANDNDLSKVVSVSTETGLRLVHQDWMGRRLDGEEWNQFPEAA